MRCSSSFCRLSGSVVTKGQDDDDGCRTRWVGWALTQGAGRNYSDTPMWAMWAGFKTDEKGNSWLYDNGSGNIDTSSNQEKVNFFVAFVLM